MMATSEIPIQQGDISLTFPARDLSIYNAYENDERVCSRWSRERHCQICGKVFAPEDIGQYVYKLHIPRKLNGVWRGEGKKSYFAWFCGYRCYRAAQQMVDEVKVKKADYAPRKIQPPKACFYCGRAFTSTVSNTKYCSDQCRNRAKGERERERKKAKKPADEGTTMNERIEGV